MRTVNEKCPIKDWEYFGIALQLDLDRMTGLTWTVEPKPEDYRPEYVVLTSDTGAKLVFSMLWSKPERVEITGQFPQGFSRRYDEPPYEITVSLTKTTSQIVREVKRRLFEQKGYGARLAEAKAQVADANDREAKRAFVAREFAQVLGTVETIERNGKPIAEVSKPLVNASPARAEFTIGYPDKDGKLDVSVEIRWCPPALAKDIAQIVAEYNAREAARLSTPMLGA